MDPAKSLSLRSQRLPPGFMKSSSIPFLRTCISSFRYEAVNCVVFWLTKNKYDKTDSTWKWIWNFFGSESLHFPLGYAVSCSPSLQFLIAKLFNLSTIFNFSRPCLDAQNTRNTILYFSAWKQSFPNQCVHDNLAGYRMFGNLPDSV